MPHRIVTADLGPNIACLTCRVHGKPAAVVNTAVAEDREMRGQAAATLVANGYDAGQIIGVLRGVRIG